MKNIQKYCDVYHSWKNYNNVLQQVGSRVSNFPSDVSEGIICDLYSMVHNKKPSGGDAYYHDSNGNRIIVEVKCCASTQDSPSSFSPSEKYDELYYVKVDSTCDLIYVYRTGMNDTDVSQIKVNRKQTVGDQQKEGRRPRFSIWKSIITPQNLQPEVVINMNTQTIIEDRREL